MKQIYSKMKREVISNRFLKVMAGFYLMLNSGKSIKRIIDRYNVILGLRFFPSPCGQAGLLFISLRITMS